MKKLILALVLILLSVPAFGQQYNWRYQSSEDCSALTAGKFADLCYDTAKKAMFKCVPSVGDCDTAGEWVQTAYSKNEVDTALALKADQSSLTAHTGNTSNPHSVTKAQVGLGSVDNTSDLNKPISTAVQSALDGKQPVGSYLTTETDPVWNVDKTLYQTTAQADAKYLQSETDPVWTSDKGDYYTATQIDQALYIQTEVDPVYSAWDKDYADLSNKPDLSIYLTDAPSDNKQYARKNANWSEVIIPEPDLSLYAQLSGATFTGNISAPATAIKKTGLDSFIPFQILGQGNYSGSPDDPTYGVGIALVYNASHNRQFWIGDTESGIGLRINENALQGWNYLTKGDSDLSIGTTTTYLDVQSPIRMLGDNRTIAMGAGNDALMFYDGANFIINPKNVGTGIVDISGGLDVDYLTATTSNADGAMVTLTSDNTTDVKRAGIFTATYSGNSNSSVSTNGINAQAGTSGSGNLTGTSAGGGLRNRYLINHAGTGLVTKASTLTARVIATGGNITTASNYYSESPNVGSGKAIASFAHFNVDGSSVTGDITDYYGILIGNIAEGTNNYAIKTGTGLNLFGDKVAFTQPDGNEFIDSLNDGYMDYGATTAHRFDNDVIVTGTVQPSDLTASKLVFTDASKNLTSTGIGTSAQFIKGDGSLDSSTYLTAISGTFVDRGDPAAEDYSVASFTADGAYHDLDLSAVVPEGAIAVLLKITIYNNTAGRYGYWRKNGNSNISNVSKTFAFVANANISNDFVIPVDVNRIIEYKLISGGWLGLGVVIAGWWI